MSDSLAPREIVVKLIDIGAHRGDAVFKRRMPMKSSLIGAALPAVRDPIGPEFMAPPDRLAA
jgi:hypothetical protein